MDTETIIRTISEAPKKTPVKAWIKGDITEEELACFECYRGLDHCVVFADWKELKPWLEKHKDKITHQRLEYDRKNSAIPLKNILDCHARIEPGAIIRDMVEIGNNAVILMGAVVNIGAVIGAETMLDMNVVVGGRAQIGKQCHIGAGSVIAGVVEPASAVPVIIEDEVMIGANVVILEGVSVGKGAVVAAGAVVIRDVAPYTVVAGVPAREIKSVDAKTQAKTAIQSALRSLE
jgi:2,3,4,5-tetrahydropyridine-2,6-dicarboxylate N-acetyltransferase